MIKLLIDSMKDETQLVYTGTVVLVVKVLKYFHLVGEQ